VKGENESKTYSEFIYSQVGNPNYIGAGWAREPV
jgi:hypothetical protein